MGIFGKPPETKPSAAAPPIRPTPPSTPAPQQASPGMTNSRSTPCIIGTKTTIKGEVLGDEEVVVEGVIEGQVRITRDLKIGPGGSVKATVEALSVVISGELIGDCTASQRVEIHATGRLTGNISSPKIVIAEGAMFKGNSNMMGIRKDERKEKVAAS